MSSVIKSTLCFMALCSFVLVACGTQDVQDQDTLDPADTLHEDAGTDSADGVLVDTNGGSDADVIPTDQGGSDTDASASDEGNDATVVHGCRLEMIPRFIGGGTQPVGFAKTVSVRLANTGTAACTVLSVATVDCPADGDGLPVCPDPLTAQPSTVFLIQTPIEQIQVSIGPGSFKEFQVSIEPEEDTPGVGPAGQLWGLLSVAFKDDASGAEKRLPECATPCEPNMLAYMAGGQASALPGNIDFGLVASGCISKTNAVCVYNTGTSPISLESISLPDCTDEFELDDVPALPLYVLAGQRTCFEAKYRPADEGLDTCSIQIVANGAADPVITIPLRAKGTTIADQVDDFIQQRSDAVDILFVIDDSGSMCDEQAVLLESFGTFIERARTWNNDFHIGVISVNADDPDIAGHLNLGDRSVSPRFLTPSPDILEKFNEVAAIGCDGSSFVESGLHASLIALMPPLTTDTTVECNTNDTCTDNPIICPTPSTCQYTCVEQSCAGYNKEFLRPDARLELIIMSDEDDQSPMPVADYVAMLEDLKAGFGPDMVGVNVIVGVEGVPLPGDEYSACTSPGGSTAVAGTRYIEAANMTDGVVASICEESFDDAMDDIGRKVFSDGGRLEYFLSRLADESTISVSINRQDGPDFTACPTGWEYNAERNSIVINPEGDCVPQTDHTIRVQYQVPCITE
ncbi:MAG TPA: hypothetical protein PLC24_04080 [Myxococcota bacterium]|nr:hypothetical protein [Myxococcota bacterium]